MEKDKIQEELVSELKIFNETIKKQQKIRRLLRNGMLNGIGFVIGTSILAGVAISILVFFFGDLPVIGSFLDKIQLDRD